MEVVRSSHDQGGSIALYTRRHGIIFSSHDNCAGDKDMRRRWIKTIGLIRPIWIWKPYRKTLEFGFEVAGVWLTVFVE